MSVPPLVLPAGSIKAGDRFRYSSGEGWTKQDAPTDQTTETDC